jgi:hypothetical protein
VHFGALPSRFAIDIGEIQYQLLALFLFTERLFAAELKGVDFESKWPDIYGITR